MTQPGLHSSLLSGSICLHSLQTHMSTLSHIGKLHSGQLRSSDVILSCWQMQAAGILAAHSPVLVNRHLIIHH